MSDETTRPTDVPDQSPPAAGLAPSSEETPEVPTSRLLVQHTMIFQPMKGQAEEVVGHNDGTFIRLLFTDAAQQPWKRRNVKIGPEWTPLQLGWIDDDPHLPSRIIILNDEGRFDFIPRPEEKTRVLARTVELGTKVRVFCPGDAEDSAFDVFMPIAEIPPHEHLSFRPVGMTFGYFLRCRSADGATVTLAAVPGDGR